MPPDDFPRVHPKVQTSLDPHAATATAANAVWMSNPVTEEPVLFVRKTGAAAATGKLLCNAETFLRLAAPDGSQYESGSDFFWEPGSGLLTLPAGSRVPFLTQEEMFPAVGAARSYGQTQGGRTGVLFAEGHFFQDLQVLADYRPRDPWSGVRPGPGSAELIRTLHLLQTRRSCRMVVLGDSISAGSNASGFNHVPPWQPPYAEVLAARLRERFAAPVEVANLSVGGKDSAWGASRAERVVAERPDLAVLAFGMNDRVDAAVFTTHMEQTVTTIQRGCPSADLILVAGMTGNPALTEFPPGRFERYRDALRGMRAPGVAVADVTSFWIDLLARKPYTDLTGNGVNHPNDFGHRVYADVIGALFQSV